MSAPRYTVLGSSGFIGTHLVQTLTLQGRQVSAPARTDEDTLVRTLKERPLDHLIYCAGLTADFRSKPFETVDAHITLLRRILESCEFDSLVYLSSTRVYQGADGTREDATLRVRPMVPDDLYNVSKLMGESLCLSAGRNCKVARVSNVFGLKLNRDSFLGAVAQEAAQTGRVRFQTSPESEKDFVALDDVVRWLSIIGPAGTKSVYNLAMGRNTSNQMLSEILYNLGIPVEFNANAPTVTFPPISTAAISAEFGAAQGSIEREFAALVRLAQAQARP